jgi:hypothetical protein
MAAVEAGVEEAVARFVELDDQNKEAKSHIKDTKVEVDRYRKVILDYMTANSIDRLTGIKNGTQYLECVIKDIRKRPTAQQMLVKLQDLLARHVTDPEAMLKELQDCGGIVAKVPRLMRRTKRVSAASLVAAAMGAAGAPAAGGSGAVTNKQKRKKAGPKKRKQAISGSKQ